MAGNLQENKGVSASLRSARGALWSAGAFSFVINLLMLTGPLFMLQVYDRVLASASVATLMALVMLITVLYLLYGFLEFIRSRVMTRIGRMMDENVRDRAFGIVNWHALKGDPQVRLAPVNDLITLRQFLSGPGPFAFFDMPWTPVYLAVIYLMHPILGLAATCAVVLLGIVAVVNNRLVKAPTTDAQKATAKAQSMSEQALRNAEVASVLGMTSALRNRWASAQQEALDAQTDANDRGGFATSTSKTLRLMFQSGILALGALLAIQQEISPGAMIAASIIMTRALAPVDQAVTHWQSFVNFRSSWLRLSMMMNRTPDDADPMPLPDPSGALSVEGLTAFPPVGDKPLIYNVNFTIPAGTGLGIIGPTGAGKSTLARAILGVWPKLRGEVHLDGASVTQWDRDKLGKHLGYLPQEVELFDGSIAENISRFNPDATPDEVVIAARHAAVHDMIVRLPDGYNTLVGTGGHRLSAGQLQRIGLARAMYGDPKLLVLDEPNSNLDADGEKALVQAIWAARRRDATVVVVAHRPSALAALDTLVMLKDGQQIAFGPKDDVLTKVLQPKSAGGATAKREARPAGQATARPEAKQTSQVKPEQHPGKPEKRQREVLNTSQNLSLVQEKEPQP